MIWNLGKTKTKKSIVDAKQAEVPRGRASGPLPRGFWALCKKELKGKPFRERDKGLLSVEVRKDLHHR